jgi:ATP-binding cassette, subfamily C, bacteriocin exporter
MIRRPKIVLQNDDSDCGAAALATIALHYRMRVPLERMRDLSGTDRIGTTLQRLLNAATAIGFSAKAIRTEPAVLAELPLPAIAHVTTEDGRGHFVVLLKIRKDSYLIADPAEGLRKLSQSEFLSRWSGYMLLAVPNAIVQPGADSAKPEAWQRLVGMLAGNRMFLANAVLCAMLMTFLGLSTSYFVQHLVDSVLVRREAQLMNALGIGMLAIVVFRVLFGVMRQYMLVFVSRRLDLTLIGDYASHILRLPLNFYEMRQAGEILSRVNDATKVREVIGGTSLTLIVDGVLVLVSASVLWVYDTPLAMLATAFVPVLIGSVLAHQASVKRGSRNAMENSAQFSAHLVEDISAVETIKAYGVEQQRTQRGETRLVRMVQDIFGLQQLTISMSSTGTLVTGVAGIAILWYGGHRVMEGALTIGQLMFFHTMLGYMLSPLESLASANLNLQDALIAVDRLYQVLDVQPEPQSDSRKVALKRVGQGVQFQDVSFRYASRDHILRSINLDIPAGKTVAVVGESGSGKSTLLRLLLRFYNPTAGRILVDGVDMRDCDLPSLRSMIGWVAQEPFIFSGTIRENICLGYEQASMAEVIEAARCAGLEDFISGLPDRYETRIGERGANLSGGQRQRLAIARALLRQPEVLIFDEATSHLDTATERAIQHSLQNALVEKTVVLVAHRLSTIRHADIIYVMHAGEIAEFGSHEDLLNRNGRYAELCRAQLGSQTNIPFMPIQSPDDLPVTALAAAHQ